MLTDLFVIVIYFLAIFCIGIYAGRKQNSLTDYALGNRSLPWWAILASILAAEISAATFLGAPGEGYPQLHIRPALHRHHPGPHHRRQALSQALL